MARPKKNPDDAPVEGEKKKKKSLPRATHLLVMPPEPDDQQAMLLFQKMGRDQSEAAQKLKRDQVRWLVQMYYIMQRHRIQSAAQVMKCNEANDPNMMLTWFAETFRYSEDSLLKAFERFNKRWRVGNWLTSLVGIGPVITAGILCGLDIRIAKHPSRFISYCGLDPSRVWESGKTRPWNAKMKTLIVFKAGESFVKTQGIDGAFYGPLFRQFRDEIEIENQNGKFKEVAAETLRTKNFKSRQPQEMSEEEQEKQEKEWKSAVEWYNEGMLPPAHLHARARRKTAKIFLSHVHHVMYEDFHGVAPDKPWVFTDPEMAAIHKHYIAPPNWPSTELAGEPIGNLLAGSPLPKSFRDVKTA